MQFEFTESEIRGRFVDLFGLANTFADRFNRHLELPLGLDAAKLYMAVVSAYDDIARYKNYHLADPANDRADSIKRAAYLARWLVHFKPFHTQVIQPAEANDFVFSNDDAALANEAFAIQLALANLSYHTGCPISLTDAKYFELLYDLIYRNIGPDCLMLFFQTIADVASKSSPIQ